MAFAAAPAVAQSNIGKAAAVRNTVQGLRGGATRSLSSGGSVFYDDAVKTGDDSLAQLLFIDQTTFTVAANSQAVLKRVFHPKQGFSQMVMHAVVGAFRFVTGVQNPTHYRIEFPQGFITVRGTIVDILVGPGHTVIILDEGAITVTAYATGLSQDLDRPGTSLVVYNDGHFDGPMTWDATLMKINGTIPFPLFGSTIWPTHQQLEPFDSRKDLNDLVGRSSSGRGGGGGGGGCGPGFTPVPLSNGTIFCSPNGP
jgi:hypothetical protein